MLQSHEEKTTFSINVDNRVIESIVSKSLMTIEGVELIGTNRLDSILGRDPISKVSAIHVEQDYKEQLTNLKIELNIAYGLSIPEKAEEVQKKIRDEVTRLTGMQIGYIHVIFKNLISQESFEALLHEPLIEEDSFSELVMQQAIDDDF